MRVRFGVTLNISVFHHFSSQAIPRLPVSGRSRYYLVVFVFHPFAFQLLHLLRLLVP